VLSPTGSTTCVIPALQRKKWWTRMEFSTTSGALPCCWPQPQQEEEPRAKVTNMLKNMTQRVKVPTMGADQLNSIRRVVHCFPVGSPSNAF
jgi:hypothetical protein